MLFAHEFFDPWKQKTFWPQNALFLQTFDSKKAFYFPVIVYPVCKPLNETGLLVFPRNPAKYREIRLKYFQIYVGKTYFILILAIRPVLFTPNVQIYLQTSSE